jgi:hypothetical protein
VVDSNGAGPSQTNGGRFSHIPAQSEQTRPAAE